MLRYTVTHRYLLQDSVNIPVTQGCANGIDGNRFGRQSLVTKHYSLGTCHKKVAGENFETDLENSGTGSINNSGR
jgi:hypothetical protein